MKKPALWILTAALLVLLALPSLVATADDATNDGTLTPEERAETLALLESTRDHVLRQAAALTDEAWTFKPGPDRWSVAEVVEHLMLTEGFLWQSADAALEADADPEWATKTEGQMAMLSKTIPDRSQPAQAPAPLQPDAEESPELSRRELVEGFLAARQKTIDFIRETGAPIKAHVIDTEFFGPMSAHHWLAFIGFHNARHNKQIDEVLEDPKRPQ